MDTPYIVVLPPGIRSTTEYEYAAMLTSFLKKLKGLLLRGEFRDYEHEYDEALVRFFLSDGYAKIKEHYARFNDILEENNRVLHILNDLQEKVGTGLVTYPYFKEEVSKLLDRITAFVIAFTRMSPNRYDWLLPVTENLKKRLLEQMENRAMENPQALYSLGQVTASMANEMGEKAARLGEVKNILNLPVPRGMVLTIQAYKHLLKANQLDKKIAEFTSNLNNKDIGEIRRASSLITDAFLKAEMPEDLVDAIEKTVSTSGDISRFAVRSSAIGEDGHHSFAGLYKTVLAVPPTEIIDAYKRVCASLYSEKALSYRLAMQIQGEPSMAVLILEMIDAKTSGVFYTVDPSDISARQGIITALWGLGQYAVDGSISPDIFIFDRQTGNLLKESPGSKNFMLVSDHRERTLVKKKVSETMKEMPSLNRRQLDSLYGFGMLLEKHFGTYLDIEWAIDSYDTIYILQVRPLKTSADQVAAKDYESDELPVLQGDPIYPGVTAGPAFILKHFDTNTIPKGSIIVTKTMDPEIAKYIPLCSGLISEVGSPAGHLATIAREFGKPSVINVKNALSILRHKEIITLDANPGKIYRGRIEALLKTKFKEQKRPIQEDVNLPVIKKIMNDILPLTLFKIPSDPVQEIRIKEEEFKTVHDIIRYVHEVSVREVFRFGGTREGDISHLLNIPGVPMQFFVIDIGDGLAPEATFKRKVRISDILSDPFHALIKGMTKKGISWSGPVEFDLGGFLSVASRSFIRSDVTDKGGRAYALVSKDYLNFHSRLAYHFTVVDTHCGTHPENNYLTFRFGGGGAGADGRISRALLLKEILESYDFRVDIRGDIVTANFRRGSRPQIERRLDQLGRLMGFTRQLDMCLKTDEDRKRYMKAFLNEDYTLRSCSVKHSAY